MEGGGTRLGQYVVIRRLGQGAAGTVFEARPITGGESVAIKCISRTGIPARLLAAEVLNLKRLDHPHVISLKEVFLTPQYLCLCLEYANGGSLASYCRQHGRMQEHAARWFFQQIILAVDYSHRRGIVNRDIKLENSLLMATQPPLCKISDFGLSKDATLSQPRSFVGTLRGGYIAPEVLEAEGKHTYDGKAADVWSCGVLLYYLVFNRGPFTDPVPGSRVTRDCIRQMLHRQRYSQYTFPPDIPISAALQNLLQCMLHPNASHRITVPGIMSHPWFVVGLPDGAQNMNQYYLDHGYMAHQPQPGQRLQSEAEMQAILAELRQGEPVSRHGSVSSQPDGGQFNATLCIDDMIAGYMDEHPSAFEIPSDILLVAAISAAAYVSR